MNWIEKQIDRNPVLTITVMIVLVVGVTSALGLPQWVAMQAEKIPGFNKIPKAA